MCAEWFDGWRYKTYFTGCVDGALCGVCRKKVHTAYQGRIPVVDAAIYGLTSCNFDLAILQDDIGDKSVFIFQALPDEEKAALIEKLEQQDYPQNLN